MKLYKYREISTSDDVSFERLSSILLGQSFWCATPASLNDPEEFIWECDYTPTPSTVSLLADLLIKYNGRDSATALEIASTSVNSDRLRELAPTIVRDIIEKCRNEIGVSCFGTSASNPIMWERYGGKGAGVCIEIDVPNSYLNQLLYRVNYPLRKVIHIDQLIEASLNDTSSLAVYSIALLSKPPFWATEEEIRFISNQQNISVNITDSTISNLTLGTLVDSVTTERILNLVNSLPYSLPISYQQA